MKSGATPIALLGLAGLAVTGQVVSDEAVKHSQAIARVRAAGRVEVDEDRPGWPVVEVCLSGREVTDARRNDLEALRQLRKLKLRDTRVTDAGIGDFKVRASSKKFSLTASRSQTSV